MDLRHQISQALIDEPLLAEFGNVFEFVGHDQHLEMCFLTAAVESTLVLNLEVGRIHCRHYSLGQCVLDPAECHSMQAYFEHAFIWKQ